MELVKQKSTLHEARVLTDESLGCERGVADTSLSEHRLQTECETDERVKFDRQDTDDVRDHARQVADAAIRASRLEHGVKKPRTPEEKNVDVALKAQRSLEDAAVTAERAKIDCALEDERKLKEVETLEFLQHDRQTTDTSLVQERSHTDVYNEGSQDMLRAERTSHIATRAILTTNDEFLAIVSHDLRNPIGSILSYADLILDDLDLTIEDAKSWAAVIRRNAKTSLKLINDIVDVERFADGKLHMNFAPRELCKLVAETVESLQNSATEHKITLRCPPGAKKLLVDCDGDRIAQVLTNLISNALKFTPEGGSVTVTAEQDKQDVRISVKDTGPGIPADQQKRVFDRYTQLGKNDRRGLGLGLYISKMIIGAHQGTLDVTSAPGHGSTFSFTLPPERRASIEEPT